MECRIERVSGKFSFTESPVSARQENRYICAETVPTRAAFAPTPASATSRM